MKKFAISILLLTFAMFCNTTCGQCPPIRGRFSSKYYRFIGFVPPRDVVNALAARSNAEQRERQSRFSFAYYVSNYYKMSNKFPTPSEVLSGRVPRYELIASDVIPDLLAQVNALSNVPELLAELLDRVKFSQSQIIVPLPRAAELLGYNVATVRRKVCAGLLPSVAVDGSPRRCMTLAQIYDVIQVRKTKNIQR